MNGVSQETSEPIDTSSPLDVDPWDRHYFGIDASAVGWQDSNSFVVGQRRGTDVQVIMGVKPPIRGASELVSAIQQKFCHLPKVNVE